MIKRRTLLAAAAATPFAGLRPAQAADEPIKIGDVNSYTGYPYFTRPYRNGLELALDEINGAGGVLGRKLQLIAYDDAGKPSEAVTRAQQLVSEDKVALLTGTFLSNVGLAVADFAARNKVPFMTAEALTDALIWSKGNRYTFRLRPGTYVQSAMLAADALKLPAKRWVTVAPNYEYGQSAVAAFKKLVAAKRPDIEWVGEQWPALGKLDAGATVEALARLQPDAILNALFGSDLLQFVRAGATRGLFENRTVVSLLTGEPEYIDPMKDDTPAGWLVTGYPWYALHTPEHDKFLKAYTAKTNEHPGLGSVVGYSVVTAVSAAIGKAGSTDPEKIVDAFEGLGLTTPFGPVTIRASDHQSTMGAFVGKTAIKDGAGIMVDWHYLNGADFLPSDAEVKELRKLG
ncbi:MAG: ABC transporter substrate-binding protein [Alphaproteobacteria bacterium]|nr:ABC transporter substrate-binding protein [Alphaproteobacteria bacterium]